MRFFNQLTAVMGILLFLTGLFVLAVGYWTGDSGRSLYRATILGFTFLVVGVGAIWAALDDLGKRRPSDITSAPPGPSARASLFIGLFVALTVFGVNWSTGEGTTVRDTPHLLFAGYMMLRGGYLYLRSRRLAKAGTS